MLSKNITLTLLLLVLLPGILFSQASGSLDLSFGDEGKLVLDNGFTDLFHPVMVQEDQKIVALGSSLDQAYQITAMVYRFLPNGELDNTFGTDGIFSYKLNFETNLVDGVIKEDGKILLVGSTTNYSNYWTMLVQLDEYGQFDNTFGENGVVVQRISPELPFIEDFGYGLALQPDGKILVAGKAHDDEYRYHPYVARFLENGEPDTSFGQNGVVTIPVIEQSNDFKSIVLQPDGKILAAGHYSPALSTFYMLAARFLPDGTPDDSFGINGTVIYNYTTVDNKVFGMALTAEGNVLLTGFTATEQYNYSMLTVQLDPAGNLNAAFGNGGVIFYDMGDYDVAFRTMVQEDNKILVVGGSGAPPPVGNSSMMVWRYNANGTPDTSFGNDGIASYDFGATVDEGMGIAIQADDKIVVVGRTNDGTNHNFVITRLHNSILISVPTLANLSGTSVSPNPVAMAIHYKSHTN
jgi:uncharacterized delta-60 repeat protein